MFTNEDLNDADAWLHQPAHDYEEQQLFEQRETVQDQVQAQGFDCFEEGANWVDPGHKNRDPGSSARVMARGVQITMLATVRVPTINGVIKMSSTDRVEI